MDKVLKFPPKWLAETQASYRQYVAEWNREEAERSVATGAEPENPQEWGDFLIESVYAELDNSTYTDGSYMPVLGDVS